MYPILADGEEDEDPTETDLIHLARRCAALRELRGPKVSEGCVAQLKRERPGLDASPVVRTVPVPYLDAVRLVVALAARIELLDGP